MWNIYCGVSGIYGITYVMYCELNNMWTLIFSECFIEQCFSNIYALKLLDVCSQRMRVEHEKENMN